MVSPMPVEGKTRREVLTEFRRAEILAAARKVFAARGFRAATLEEVAVEAGLAKGTLYLYFPSKEEMFWAIFRGRVAEMHRRLQAVLCEPGGTEDKIRAGLRVRFELLREDQDFMRIYLTEFGQCIYGGPWAKEFRKLHLAGARLLAPVLAEGIRRGELRPVPPLETALALMDLVKSIVSMKLLGMHENRFDVEQFIFDLFWRGVRAEGAAAGGGQ
jgi:AcrR family transcriptional regulator